MRRIPFVSAVLLAVFFPLGAWAQSGGAPADSSSVTPTTAESSEPAAQEAGTIARVYLSEVRPGMVSEWLAAAAEHVEWHREQGDTWVWTAFYVETGKYTGSYGWVTGDHDWSDFDEYDNTLGPADGEHAMASFGQYTESFVSWFAQDLPEVSNTPPAGETAPLYNITQYRVHMGHADDFMAAISKAHTALADSGFDTHYWWAMELGGEGPTYTLILPMDTWTDMAPAEPSLDQLLEEALGRYEAQALLETFSSSVASMESWVVRTLPELTCCPAQ